MSKLITPFLILLMTACQSKETHTELAKSKPDYTIQVNRTSCFGRQIDLLEIRKDSAEYRWSNPDNPDSTVHLKTIAWTSIKKEQLQHFIKLGTRLDSRGFCTTHATYKVITSGSELTFEDSGCKLDEKFSALIN